MLHHWPARSLHACAHLLRDVGRLHRQQRHLVLCGHSHRELRALHAADWKRVARRRDALELAVALRADGLVFARLGHAVLFDVDAGAHTRAGHVRRLEAVAVLSKHQAGRAQRWNGVGRAERYEVELDGKIIRRVVYTDERALARVRVIGDDGVLHDQ